MKEAIVTANRISVRTGRNVNYEKLGEYVKNDRIIVLDEELDQSYAEVLWQAGYAYSDNGKYIQFIDEEEPTQPAPEPNAVVTANRISVRTGRGVRYDKLGEFKNGDKITVLDDTLDYKYSHVVWQDGDGYAYCKYGKYIEFIDEEKPPQPEPEPNAIITANRISVRTGRGVEYEKLGEFKNGDNITVLDDTLDYKYSHVVWQDGDGYAYCEYGQYIKFIDEESPENPEPNAMVTANRISVRTGRSVYYDKLGEFKNGDIITVLDDTLDYKYSHVVWQDGDGYAYCEYGKYIRYLDTDITEPIKKTLDIAASCVGGQYIFGGQGNKITESYVKARKAAHPEYFTNGRYEYLLAIGKSCDAKGVWEFPHDYAWDCSGLWWYSANEANIYGSYKDSTAQTFYTSYCTPISKSDLKAGDAVFYQNSAGRISHMGIVGYGGVVYEAMSGYTGVIKGDSVNDRTADKIVGSGTLTRSAWNHFGRPKIFQ